MDDNTRRNLELHFESLELDELARDIAYAAIDVTGQDGAHHKRWLLQEIVRKIQACEQVTKEPGISP